MAGHAALAGAGRLARLRVELARLLGVLALGCGGFVTGYVLVGLGARFDGVGHLVVLALPIVPAMAAAVLANPRVGVLAIVASFPAGVASVPVLPLQLVQLVVLAVAVLVALRRLTSTTGPLPLTPTMGWAAAFCVWLVIALPSALDHQLASREVVLYAIGLVTASVVVAACRHVVDVRNVLRLVLLAATVVAAMVPFNLGQLRVAHGGAVVAGRATGIFNQPNQLGTFAATGALLGIGLTVGAETRRARALLSIATAICVVGLLLSLSRGAWIGFAVGLVVLVAKVPEVRLGLLLAAAPLFVVALLVGSFAPTSPQVEIVGQRLQSVAGERNPYDNRPAIWEEAYREIRADPVTGQGPGNYPAASTRATSASRTVFADHAHNIVLTWAAEDGLPAVALAAALVVALHVRLRRVARLVDRGVRPVVAGVAAALAAILGQGAVDYTLRNSVLLTTVFLLLGCAFAYDDIVLRRRVA